MLRTLGAGAVAAVLTLAAGHGSARAADAAHPYSNVNHANDAGNDTGDSETDQLNEQQLQKASPPGGQSQGWNAPGAGAPRANASGYGYQGWNGSGGPGPDGAQRPPPGAPGYPPPPPYAYPVPYPYAYPPYYVRRPWGWRRRFCCGPAVSVYVP